MARADLSSDRHALASETRRLVERVRTEHDTVEISNRTFAITLAIIVASIVVIMILLKR